MKKSYIHVCFETILLSNMETKHLLDTLDPELAMLPIMCMPKVALIANSNVLRVAKIISSHRNS